MIRPTITKPFSTTALATAVCFCTASVSFGQAGFIEDFENVGTVQGDQHGPPGLIADGWIFRNQSDPQGSGDWRRSGWAYQGNWSLTVDVTVSFWDGNNAEASTWALLPEIAGQMAGDELRFFYFNTQAPPLVPSGHLEIRYSPSGSTDTGENSDDVGDFTQLLSDIPATESQWTEHTVTLPGNGRLALRYHVPQSESQENFWGFFEIDNLTVGPGVTLPPIPAPGETVHWTTALSPVVIDENLTISQGGTLIVDPDVIVEVNNSAIFTVEGSLIAEGASGMPVTLAGTSRIEVPGTLEFDQAVVDVLIQPDNGGSLTFTNTTFESAGSLTTVTAPTYIWGAPPFVSVENCTFNGTYLWVGDCTLALRNTTFDGDFCGVGYSYLLVDGLSSMNSALAGLDVHSNDQPLYLNNLSVTNSSVAGMKLAAGNFFIGDNVELSGNPYPVQVSGAGILPGSSLPITGNIHNAILADENLGGAVGGSVWADTGLPYVLPGTYSGGNLQILPGVTVQLGSDVTFWGEPGFIEARGLPEAPVVFERLNSASSWQGLQYFHRFENALIDGGQIGARFHSASTVGYIDNSVIQNCDYGTQNDVVVRKTRFINNLTGSWGDNWPEALNGETGANSFEGNGAAVDSTGLLIDAPFNWWNDPSGPNSPDNPGGQGELVLGAGVDTIPFLTAPPDFTDHPPIVNMDNNSFLAELGETVILSWTSQDDHGIVGHRVEFDHPLDGLSVIAELPGSQMAYEWTVPDIGFAVNGASPIIRVTAIDAAGQEGWDEQGFLIPTGDVQGTLTITSDLSGPFVAGHDIGQLCWTPEGTNPLGYSVTAFLLFDGDQRSMGLGGVTSYLQCLSGEVQVPFASTDTARIVLRIDESLNNVKYFFSEPFTIRPDSRIGDEPPSITMLSPAAGETFAGGQVIPISWTASDDEALRGFDVQASYDGGRAWHVIADDLPPEATSFNWQLPPSEGIADVRIRVIASDLRFQTSSDGGDAVCSVTPGNESIPGDANADGAVDVEDLLMLLSAWGACTDCPEDTDGDDLVDVIDLLTLLANWS